MTLIKIEPSYKKSVVDIEFFKNDEDVWVHYEQGWRWGTFFANVTDEEMEELLEHNKYCEENNVYDDFEISALTDYEMNDTWDGCWGDIRVWKTDWSEEQRQELKETIESSDDWWDWLMEHGFEPQDSETYICGVIDIEKIDHLPWDAPE
jgi:hypothetical protein